MKLGIVYTSTTPELIECVNEEIRKNLGDTPEILNYQDPSILAEVREVCDYILIISKGKLVASDTPENLELLRNGASSLELEVKAAPETARAILSTIDDINTMEMHIENENLTRIKLETKNGADIREAVFYAFAEEKCPLLEMKTAKASLEDIFMELTQKEESNDAGNL